MNYKTGNELDYSEQRHVLAAFVHRFTREHRPHWAASPEARVQFANDAEWLANTRFAVRSDGRLDRRFRHCESNPTWPDNPELRRTARQLTQGGGK